MPLLVADNLTKTYVTGDSRVTALAGVSFQMEPGEFVALMGPSGCGKSTLLHLCGAMDRPSNGTLTLNDRDLASLSVDRNVPEALRIAARKKVMSGVSRR